MKTAGDKIHQGRFVAPSGQRPELVKTRAAQL